MVKSQQKQFPTGRLRIPPSTHLVRATGSDLYGPTGHHEAALEAAGFTPLNVFGWWQTNGGGR